jgi:hypothetical protein
MRLEDDVTLEPKAQVACYVVHHGVRNLFADEFVSHHAEGVDRCGQTISLAVVEDAHQGPPPFIRRQN